MEEIDCSECIENLKENSGAVHHEIFDICRKSEFVIDLQMNRLQLSFSNEKIMIKVLSMMTSDTCSEICDDHIHGAEDFLDNYRISLIKSVIKTYVNLRSKDKFKRISDSLHDEFIRQKNKKLTLFSNQLK